MLTTVRPSVILDDLPFARVEVPGIELFWVAPDRIDRWRVRGDLSTSEVELETDLQKASLDDGLGLLPVSEGIADS